MCSQGIQCTLGTFFKENNRFPLDSALGNKSERKIYSRNIHLITEFHTSSAWWTGALEMVDKVYACSSILAGLKLALIHFIFTVDTLVPRHTLQDKKKYEESFHNSYISRHLRKADWLSKPSKGQITISFVAIQLQVTSRATQTDSSVHSFITRLPDACLNLSDSFCKIWQVKSSNFLPWRLIWKFWLQVYIILRFSFWVGLCFQGALPFSKA